MLHIPLYLHLLPTNFEGPMKPDFSDYIIAVLFELNDGLPHSMDWCVDKILDKCCIEYEISLVGHYLKKRMSIIPLSRPQSSCLKPMVSLRLTTTITQCSPEKAKDILK